MVLFPRAPWRREDAGTEQIQVRRADGERIYSTEEARGLACREPARDIPLMTKVMRKEARHTQRRDQASGVLLDILEHLPPKKPESAYFIALCSHL